MTPVGIRRVTVTGLLILTTTVALGCGAGAPKGSDDPLVDPVGADAATTPPDDGAGASVDGGYKRIRWEAR